MAVSVNLRRRYRGRTRSTMKSALRHLTNLVNQSTKATGECAVRPPADRPNTSPSGLLLTGDVAMLRTAIAVLNRNLATLGPVPTCTNV